MGSACWVTSRTQSRTNRDRPQLRANAGAREGGAPYADRTGVAGRIAVLERLRKAGLLQDTVRRVPRLDGVINRDLLAGFGVSPDVVIASPSAPELPAVLFQEAAHGRREVVHGRSLVKRVRGYIVYQALKMRLSSAFC